MASIDKIYGNQDQYIQLYKFCKEHRSNVRKQLRLDIMKRLYDYGYNEELDFCNMAFWPNPEEEKTLSNFSREIDSYLWDNCKLDFVQNRLKEQYSEKPIPRKRYILHYGDRQEMEFNKIQEAVSFVDSNIPIQTNGYIGTRTSSNIIDFEYDIVSGDRLWYANRRSCFRLLFGVEEYRKMIQEMKEIEND